MTENKDTKKPALGGEMKKIFTGRRRWLWTAGGVVILSILIVLALPSLLCTGPGVRFIESKINSRIKGQVQIDQLTLGWFSPTSLKGVTLLGPSGETIISGLNVDTQLSLLHLLNDRQNLGKIAISIDQVQVQSQGNGNINLLEAIAGKASGQSQQPSTSTPTSGQHTPSTASATTLPLIVAQIDCQIKSFSMTSPNAPELKAENISFNTGIDTSGTGPTTTHLSAAVGVGAATPTQIALDANLEIFNHNQLLPLEQIAGGVESKIDGLDLSVFEPILSAEGIGLVASGKLTLDISTTLANKPESGQIKGTASISGLEISGTLLKGDDAKIGDVQIPIDANWEPGSFSINQLAFESSPANISISGSGSPAAIDAAIHHLSGTNGMAQFKVDCTVQSANLLDMFPNLSGPLITAISLPANTHFSGGETKTTAQITLGGAAASTETSASSAQAMLPQASGTLQISSQPLQWSQSSGENYSQEASLNCQLAFDTSGKPIQVQLLVSSGEGQANPMQVSLAGNVTMLANQNILPLDEWNGPLELKVEQFQLPDLARFNLPIVPAGTLNGDLKMDAEGSGKGSVTGQLTVDQLVLSGSMLDGDQPQIGTLSVPIDVDWNGENLTINQLGYKNTAATLNMSGTTSIPSLKAMMKPGGDWGNTDLKLQATYDLAAISKELPHVLRLSDKNLIVNSGTENVNFEFSNTSVESKCTLMADLTNFAGQWQQRPFTIDPLLLQAAAARSNQIWNLISAQLSQGTSPYELNVQVTPGTGQTQAYTLDCQADLAKAVAEVGQIVDLKGVAAAGQLDWKTQANNIFSPTIGYTTALNWNNASIVPGTGKTPINEPQITLNAQGNVDMMGGIFNGLTSNFDFTNSTISITQSQLQLKLDAQRNLEIPALALNISNISLARLTELLAPMVKNMDQYNIGGQISNSVIDASYSPGSINISKVHMAVNNITVSSNTQSLSGVQFLEPSLVIDLAGTVQNGATSEVNFSILSFTTGDQALDVSASQPVTISEATQGGITISCPNLGIDGDLSKLEPLLVVMGKLSPSNKLQGALAFKGDITQTEQTITLSIDGTVNNYQRQNPQSTLQLPPTNLFASLNGQLDIASDAFTIQKDSQIGERAVDGSGSNQATLYQGTAVSWAPGAKENVHATISYDLARLQLLLGPILPKGLTMSGRHSVDIQITGDLTQDKGIQMLRDLTINPMAPAFDQIAIDGLTLGPGSAGIQEQNGVITLQPASIPANKGYVHLAGYVDLNQAEPAMQINQPLQILQNVQINSQLGSTLLDFLPMAWGGNQSALTITGLANLQIQQAFLPVNYDQLKTDGTMNGTVSITHLTTNSPIFGDIGKLTNPLGIGGGGGGVQLANSGISPTNFQLKNGKVTYQNMQLTLITFGMELTGWVALDTTMHMDVSVTGAGITLPIPLAIDGTTGDPKVKLSAKSIGNTLQGVPNLLNNILGH